MQTRALDYRDGAQALSGILFHDDSAGGMRPGIVVPAIFMHLPIDIRPGPI